MQVLYSSKSVFISKLIIILIIVEDCKQQFESFNGFKISKGWGVGGYSYILPTSHLHDEMIMKKAKKKSKQYCA